MENQIYGEEFPHPPPSEQDSNERSYGDATRVESYDTGVVGHAPAVAFGHELITSSASAGRAFTESIQQQARDFQLKQQQTALGVTKVLGKRKVCRLDAAELRAEGLWERAGLIEVAGELKAQSMLELENLIG